jgi:hypothetical protein
MYKVKIFSRAACGLFIAAACAAVALVFFTAPAAAEQTRFWRQSDYEVFERGTAKGTAVGSDGKITLAPKFTTLADAGMAYLWGLVLDSRGNLYAAGGANAKVVRIGAAGQITPVFDSTELSAQALAVDRNDNLYVATAPDGKVYRVTSGGQKTVFFDPQSKYIWDLVMAPDGTIYVATGDAGKIFSVSADGKGELFYSSSETHIRALALDGKGNLLAGTEPSGLVMRIPLANPPASPGGRGATQAPANTAPAARQAYVVYETARREITSLIVDPDGNLYVGAIGEKPRIGPGAPQGQAQNQQQLAAAAAAAAAQAQGLGGNPQAQGQQQATPFQPFPAVTSSAVYRIGADGAPEELWTDRDDLVYSLGLSRNGKLLLGTGNRGAVIQLDGNRIFSRLVETNSGQITALARDTNGKTYLATANPGRIFTLGPEPETEGTFESQPFDARIFSRWGRLSWWGENAARGTEFYVRAGNTSDPENSWSPWSGPYRTPNGTEVQAPAARFVQWKAVLHSGEQGANPAISWVDLAYLPKNMAPRIDAIAVQNPGIRVQMGGGGGQAQASTAAPLRMPVPVQGTQAGPQQARQQQTDSAPSVQRVGPPPQGFSDRGHQAVLWAADDSNDDELIYSVYYRGESERDWKLLREDISQRFYSWDTTSMPDGAYYLKIVASDERANAPGESLSAERESDRFVVDNTAPQIPEIVAEPLTGAGATGVNIRFRARDATSAIVNAQYSLDAGEWTLALPSGGVSDSLEEPYVITLRNVAPGEHTVAVRVYDQYDNLAAAKVTFTVPPARR